MYTRSGYARARYARRVGVQWSRSGALALGRRRTARGGAGGSRTGSRILAILLVLPLLVLVAVASSLGLAATAAVAVLSSDLPDPSTLNSLTFSQPTVVYDRTGTVQLGVFQQERRRVIAFDQVPKLVLDATTTAEDRTFWQNAGFDPAAILSAIAENASGESERGASTITQQLVRARLLPAEVTAAGSDRYIRKAKELIQSSRLTDRFPGEAGKEQIVTAYLNQIFYGHDAYGIAAAADIYFGVTDLAKLTPAQAALLAGLPKSPSTLDPYRYAQADAEGHLVVPPTAPPVVRRNYILQSLNTSRWTTLTKSQLQQALAEPVVLIGERPLALKAPHFTWQVRRQLEAILGDDAPIETSGYTVITTLNWDHQSQAERWLAAAAVAPNLTPRDSERLLKSLKIPAGDQRWINALRGKDLHNASLVDLDYKTGDVLAYAGSAGYYAESIASKKFEPKYDVAGDGERQPGSAWKPIVYASAFDTGALTPGSLLLDVTTEFNQRENWAPRDADQLDRGPVLVRKALQYSLNIPAIRALQRVGNEAVADRAEAMGIRFHGGKEAFLQSGLAGAIGTVEVRPLDLTSAYGALANWGGALPPRMILEIRDASGKTIYQADPHPAPKQTVSSQAAFLVTSILSGNTDPRQNPIWSAALELRNGPNGEHRPAAVKTGTANEARDLATYGYLGVPDDPSQPSLAVGIWMGNSDHSNPRSSKPATSLTAAAPLWRAFVRDITNGTPIANFSQPKGLVSAAIDKWSGGRPGPWTRSQIRELFIDGTQPGAKHAVDSDGLLYSFSCGGWRVDPIKAEVGPRAWDADVANWLTRARRGLGVLGPHDSRTAYFWGERSWGGPLAGPCIRPKPPEEKKEDKEKDRDKDKGPKPPPSQDPKPSPKPKP
ncbi:MAG TPA: transglycosylase domain-containing protein [Candidatus Limnocylindrales bacterium]|nr:transglycosylase domain-containing protein [Candidatus Limnocylindrales bacterium]